MESHNKIIKRKIESLRRTSDGASPTKLPFAVLASNTKIKRATKFSAFGIMFGRTCEAVPLLNMSKSHSAYPTEQSFEDESINPDSLSDPYARKPTGGRSVYRS